VKRAITQRVTEKHKVTQRRAKSRILKIINGI